MTQFEILEEMCNLCNEHDIQFEVNRFGVIIRKYFYDDSGRPCNPCNISFSFELLKHIDLQDCVLEFEKQIENWEKNK